MACRSQKADKEIMAGHENLIATMIKRMEAAEQGAQTAKRTAEQSLRIQKEFASKLDCLEKDMDTMKQQVQYFV
jgi:hypothetical protein